MQVHGKKMLHFLHINNQLLEYSYKHYTDLKYKFTK